MDYVKYLTTIAILLVIAILYEKYKSHYLDEDDMKQYELVRKYLLNDSSLALSKKPILWIHNDYETNARWWASWGSRDTTCLNQPYQYLTIKSIIDKCGGDFNVCLIDDSTFNKIIPGWTIDMTLLAEPMKSKFRRIAISRLLRYFGGMIIPGSFICFKSLIEIYEVGVANTGMFVGEIESGDGKGPPRSAPMPDISFPSVEFMGCVKDSPTMGEYGGFLELLASQDYTAESDFLGADAKWCMEKIRNHEINVVDAQLLGTRDANGRLVTLETILGNSEMPINDAAFGMSLPGADILRRTKYGWFARMSAKQVLDSNTNAGAVLYYAHSL